MTATSVPPDDVEVSPVDESGRRAGPTIGTALRALVLAWGAALAAFPLSDNSFLTHLATGRLILDRGAVPTTDPYSFTAPGTTWTVQSWLVSVVSAGAERAGGVVGLRILQVVVLVSAAALVWRLTRACTSLLPRLAIVCTAMAIATALWGERPYMVGVIGLGLVWLALDDALPVWTMVPVFWVWANAHGSFPLGVGLVVLVVIGRHFDGVDGGRGRQVLAWSLGGTALAALSPLGPRGLLFPLTALSKADVLSAIREWQPPTYQSLDQRLFLVLVVATLLSLVRRPTWAAAIPVVVFCVAAQLAQRNMVMALMVLLPVLAANVGAVGELRVDDRPSLVRVYAALGAVAVVAGVVAALAAPFGSLDATYPTGALARLEPALADRTLRLAAPDRVGNLREVLDGAQGTVFFDDRIDMYPRDVVEDVLVLERGEPGWARVLDRYAIDLVVWDRSGPLGSILAADDGWRIAYSEGDWFVACRRGPACVPFD